MTRHTPGPWHADEKSGQFVIKADGQHYFIARVVQGGLVHKRTRATTEANARLIAAAPELLEALKDALNETHYWRDRAMDAIAKATGE